MYNSVSSTGNSRRSAQTVLTHALRAISFAVAPIAPFTADDIYQHSNDLISMTSSTKSQFDNEDDHCNTIFHHTTPEPEAGWNDPILGEHWRHVLNVRDTVNVLLENARKDKVLGSSKEARVEIKFTKKTPVFESMSRMKEDLVDVMQTVRYIYIT